jgi:hypothetical protein
MRPRALRSRRGARSNFGPQPKTALRVNAISRKLIFPLVALALILVLQAGLTFLDTTPRYLLGDSASYLWSVFHDGPFDRSWTYPAWYLSPILTLHSLNLVVYVQCALGVIPAWLAFGLVSGQDGRRCDIVAFVAACVCLIEPLALIYQRFILADGMGLIMAAAALFASVRLIDKNAGATAYAALTPLFLVLAASLRSSQIPSLALLCAFLLVLLFLIYRKYTAGVAFVGSLVLCNAVFFHYANEHQHARGYNAKRGSSCSLQCCPSFRVTMCGRTSTRRGRRRF